MNIFNLIKDILEFLYYLVGILGIIGVFLTYKNYKKEKEEELKTKFENSKKKFEELKVLLNEELKKDKRGKKDTKYSEYCFSSDIIEYLSGNGDLKTSQNFKIIKNEEEINRDFEVSIKNVLELLRDSLYYLSQPNNEANDEFYNLCKEYLANTIILMTRANYNYDYKDELKFIAKKIGVEKISDNVIRNCIWQELIK